MKPAPPSRLGLGVSGKCNKYYNCEHRNRPTRGVFIGVVVLLILPIVGCATLTGPPAAKLDLAKLEDMAELYRDEVRDLLIKIENDTSGLYTDSEKTKVKNLRAKVEFQYALIQEEIRSNKATQESVDRMISTFITILPLVL